jgi:hypothetical protein
MELTARASAYLYLERFNLVPQLPARLLVVLVMLVGFTGVNVAAMGLGGQATRPPDLFSSFADVFPGQPRSAVVARGFSCAMGTYPVLPDEYCTLSPAAGAFTQVGAVVSHGIVIRTDFILRSGSLRFGDLAELWGVPENQEYEGHHVADYFWHGKGVSASAFFDTGRFSLFLPVRSVSFTDLPT